MIGIVDCSTPNDVGAVVTIMSSEKGRQHG